MYLNSSSVPAPTSFAPTPVQFSDINATAQQQHQQHQQQLHYSLLNFNAAAVAGLIAPSPIVGSANNINQNGTQSSSQTNESGQQQQSSQSNQPLYSALAHSSAQQILVENPYSNVLLREKNPNQLYDPRKTRKRLSDPVFTNNLVNH
jgi:hypothetical protein